MPDLEYHIVDEEICRGCERHANGVVYLVCMHSADVRDRTSVFAADQLKGPKDEWEQQCHRWLATESRRMQPHGEMHQSASHELDSWAFVGW